ncbi:MGME1 [Lepeophtheirus salmonis]|uniref:MGME1 n=1 Tax=Lepeophtheirus salmonis TaxID=72036 RepID=A0A7R8CJ44_LEPSM|nr:MGME1 [Lepeophtheirus salmonis]CAF2838974.1 MGME1 [Lepeophtheirus salmonis]
MESGSQKSREVLFNEAIQSFISDLKPKLNLKEVKLPLEGCDEFLLESLQLKSLSRLEKDIRQSVESDVEECGLIKSLQSLDALIEKADYQCSWRPSGNPSEDLLSSDVEIYGKAVENISTDSLSRDVSKLEAQIISLAINLEISIRVLVCGVTGKKNSSNYYNNVTNKLLYGPARRVKSKTKIAKTMEKPNSEKYYTELQTCSTSSQTLWDDTFGPVIQDKDNNSSIELSSTESNGVLEGDNATLYNYKKDFPPSNYDKDVIKCRRKLGSPSVTKILDSSMSADKRTALFFWEQKMIQELEYVVVDWKTSDKKKRYTSKNIFDNPVQVAAYFGAINYDSNYTVKPHSGLIVIAYNDGTPANILKMSNNALEYYWREWKIRLHIHRKMIS